MIDGRARQFHDLLGGQVVQLHGLTGGELDRVNAIGIGRVHDERELVLAHASAGHTQAQHAALAVALGIAAKAARDALVFLSAHLARIVLARGLIKLGQIIAESLNEFLLHKNVPPFIKLQTKVSRCLFLLLYHPQGGLHRAISHKKQGVFPIFRSYRSIRNSYRCSAQAVLPVSMPSAAAHQAMCAAAE